ncbi:MULTISPECIES: hypothetical protein [Nocardia]|uniref:hypothetical protein n=1 Tax=Nocardia TaxID=1817 RepID=UPI000D68CF17|nr:MULTISPECIES: hypothetical protein [Nocardia]
MSDDTGCEVLVVTDLDTAHAIRNALHRCGCTFEELADMHRVGQYATIRHRLAWVAIGAHYDEREYFAGLLEGNE